MATELKPARVNLMGGWVQIVDDATDQPVGSFNIPRNGKPGAWPLRVVKAMASKGYDVLTCESMAGPGIPALLIGARPK